MAKNEKTLKTQKKQEPTPKPEQSEEGVSTSEAQDLRQREHEQYLDEFSSEGEQPRRRERWERKADPELRKAEQEADEAEKEARHKQHHKQEKVVKPRQDGKKHESPHQV